MPKSKYHSHVEPKLPLIEKWARDGLTLDQIAANLGVARSTFFKYSNEQPDLSNAIKNGKEVSDAHVVNKLYQNAMGFYYKEEVMTPGGQILEIERYSKPNTTAQIFWLKNRLPSEWREKQEVEHSGQVTHTDEQTTHIIHELITDPEVAERIKHSFRRRIVSGASET